MSITSLLTHVDASAGRYISYALWRGSPSRFNSLFTLSFQNILSSAAQKTKHAPIVHVLSKNVTCAIDSLHVSWATGIDGLPLEIFSETPIDVLRLSVNFFSNPFQQTCVLVAIADLVIISILKTNFDNKTDSFIHFDL